MKIKYSVIIPIYNSEKTLERCLASLLWQRRDDVEVIAINDGSTDKSGKILAEYAEAYDSLVRIDEKNSGVSTARNTGIERATGTYILFVDSDDFVSKNYFDTLDHIGKQNDDDLFMFASNTVGGRNPDESRLYHQLEKLEENGKKMELLLRSRKVMSPCNKRFKRAIILKNHIRFIKKLQTGEDFNFCLEYMLNCDTISIKYQKLYNVDISDRLSLSRKYRANLDIQLEKVFQHAAGLIQDSRLDSKEKEDLLRVVDYLFVKSIFTCIAEEFKNERFNYRNRKGDIVEIYKKFLIPLCSRGSYCNLVHRTLRILVKYRCVLPVYGITKLVKEKQFSKYTEG